MSRNASRKHLATFVLILSSLWSMASLAGQSGNADPPATDPIPATHLVQPSALAQSLASGTEQPLIFQVGSRMLFAQAHIPGSVYVGAAGQPEGLHALEQRVRALKRNRHIVIYCGCCPWPKCPNIREAYRKLAALGFTHVQVLYIAENFGTDWVDRGFPVAGGEP